MKFSSLFVPETPVSDDANAIPTFRVLIIYDTRQLAIRAKSAFDRLIRRFSDDFDFQYDLWRWDLLQIPEAEKNACWAGKIADLIIIASGDPATCGAIQAWLCDCIRRRTEKEGALISLFASGDEAPKFDPEMRRMLHPVAEGLGFYVHEVAKEKAPKPRVILRDHKTTSTKSWDSKMAELEAIHAEIAPEIRELRATQAQQEYPFNCWRTLPSPYAGK